MTDTNPPPRQNDPLDTSRWSHEAKRHEAIFPGSVTDDGRIDILAELTTSRHTKQSIDFGTPHGSHT